MISAFGVDHGEVSKSLVPGKGFVSASTLGAKKLREVTKPGQYASRGLSRKQKDAQYALKANNDLFGGRESEIFSMPKGKKGKLHISDAPDLAGTGLGAVAFKTGGKDGQRRILMGPDAEFLGRKDLKRLKEHEIAHVTPGKRTSWRMASIASDPKKIMREEGRADMVAGLHYADSAKHALKARKHAARSKDIFDEDSMKSMTARQRIPSVGYNALALIPEERAAQRAALLGAAKTLPKGDQRRSIKQMAERNTDRSFAAYRSTQDKIAAARSRGGSTVAGYTTKDGRKVKGYERKK